MMKLIILPNQLFEIKYIPNNIKKIIIIEEPIYFGYRDIKYKFNKLKLVLHRSSMRYYYDYLKNKYNVKYIDFKNIDYRQILSDDIIMFNPHDYFLQKKYKKINKNIKYIDNPNFILTEEQIKKYYEKNKNKKNIRHSGFYNYVKKELNILKNVKSYDKQNREPLDKNTIVPKLKKQSDNKYIIEAKKYVDKLFPNNYGDVEDFIYPITHNDSKKWFNNFVKTKLNNFGKYQDAIDSNNPFVFHSVISPMLNIGLIMPQDILEELKKIKNKTDMNNYEGYIRQLIGWR